MVVGMCVSLKVIHLQQAFSNGIFHIVVHKEVLCFSILAWMAKTQLHTTNSPPENDKNNNNNNNNDNDINNNNNNNRLMAVFRDYPGELVP